MVQTQSEIDTVLDRTYDALISGDLAALGPLGAAMAALPDLAGLDRSGAIRIRRKAERNARLLQAAQRGLRTARGRLAEIAAEPALTTYDAQGQKASVGQVAAGAPRRF